MKEAKTGAKPGKHRWLGVAFFLLLWGGDQFTKWLAVHRLQGTVPFVVIPGVLEFSYWENTGAAFSSFQGMNTMFIVLNTLLMALIAIALFRIPLQRKWLPLHYTGILLVAGGLGNVADRVVRGFVVDFISFVPINFPMFNLADSYITVSVILLFILVLFTYKNDDIIAMVWPKKKKV